MAASKDNKILNVYQSESLRQFVNTVNGLELPKEDVVKIFQDINTHEYVLLYYR